MCGIGGILHADPERHVSEADLAPMLRALRHRGPDGEGTFVEGAFGLCHTRLAVLDLSPRARQPMASERGRYRLSYNGEIYNYRELRDELRRAGCSFRSDGDSEVILQLAEHAGLAALERLEGMFAFALYDRERRELLLMRDRLGIKPLFWCAGDWGVAFASEPKALPRLTEGGRPSPARLAEYLSFRHLAGEESLLPGVHTLLPGHRMVTDGRSLRTECWWHGSVPSHPHGDREVTGEIVASAVRRQLVSDVPVGVFLSGGIDSALVTAAACDALPAVETFTVGFHEPGWDETARARVVSEALQTKAHELRLTADDYAAGLGDALWHLDAPLNHAHSVHVLALSRFARRHITVALTGEGSDEIFGGYPRYRLFLLARLLRAPASVLRAASRAVRTRQPRWARLLDAAACDAATAAAINAAFVPLPEAAQVVGLEQPEAAIEPRRALFEEARRSGLGELESLLGLERRTYLVSLLQRMDRMSMAVGLECRVPLLDERVVEHAAALAAAERVDLFDTKKPMRHAAARRFGSRHAQAPKSGFGVPLDAWLRGDGLLARRLRGILDDPCTRKRGWFDVDLAGRRLKEHRDGARDHTELLWGILNLELWARVGVDGAGPAGAGG